MSDAPIIKVQLLVCGVCKNDPLWAEVAFRAVDSEKGQREIIRHLRRSHNIEVGEPR